MISNLKFSRINQKMAGESLIFFICAAPVRKIRRMIERKAIGRAKSLEDRFTIIYNRNSWRSKESLSGSGSTISMTSSIRTLLPVLVHKFKVKSIFDAPCGDFNWMRMVDLSGISYVGADIVRPLIFELQERYTSTNISFVHLDITADEFPKSDLVLIRDCLFHLSYKDILSTLKNYLDSRSPYILTTSHDNKISFENSDICSGGFRVIDLFSSPFNFPNDPHFEISEPGEGSLPARKLYLWDRNQVQVAHATLERFLSGL